MTKWHFWPVLPWGRVAKAKHLFQQGATAYANGEFHIAAEKWEKVQRLFEAAGERKLLAACENSLGNAYQRLGQPTHALQAYERALALQQALGDRRGEAADLANTGAVYQNIGELDQAEALARLRERGLSGPRSLS